MAVIVWMSGEYGFLGRRRLENIRELEAILAAKAKRAAQNAVRRERAALRRAALRRAAAPGMIGHGGKSCARVVPGEVPRRSRFLAGETLVSEIAKVAVDTVKLASSGVTVLAKTYKGGLCAVTYANRTQAMRKVEELMAAGVKCELHKGLGRPFYVRFDN